MKKEIAALQKNVRILLLLSLLVTLISCIGVFVGVLFLNSNKVLTENDFRALIADKPDLEAYYLDQIDFAAHFVTAANAAQRDAILTVTYQSAIVLIPIVLAALVVLIILSKKIVSPIKQSEQEKTQFIEDAAHELRNPIGAIKATLQNIMLANSLPKTLEKDISGIVRQADALNKITNDLILLENPGKSDITEFDLFEVMQDVLDQLNSLAIKSHVSIEIEKNTENTDFVGSLEDIVVIFRNILTNSINYAKKEGGVVRVRIEKTKKNNIAITITDDGLGIPSKDLHKIGDRFFRATNSNKGGTGLGISIVKKLVAKYGGSFSIISELGSGTSVEIQLPSK